VREKIGHGDCVTYGALTLHHRNRTERMWPLGLELRHVVNLQPTEYKRKKTGISFQARWDGEGESYAIPELSGGMQRRVWPSSCYGGHRPLLFL